MQEELYIDAPDAAAQLGVSMATLYAYVSRKGLRSFPIEGTRRKRYWRADIEALRLDKDRRAVPDTVLVHSSSLTLLTDAGLFYRGRKVTDLADDATLEDVAALLLDTDRSIFETGSDEAPENMAAVQKAVAHLGALDRALSLLPSIEFHNPRSADLSPAGFSRTASSVLRWLAAICARQPEGHSGPLHLAMSRAAASDGRFDDLVRRALVLGANHELDPATYAVRAAANTGITPYGAAIAGLVASRGQRLRHHRALRTAQFVQSIIASPDPAREVQSLYRIGEAIPGFRSEDLHRQGDPRAGALLKAMREQLHGHPDFIALDQAIAAAFELTGREPGFLLPTVFLGLQLGLADEPLTFMLTGRMIGWLAHAREQVLTSELVRPRTPYVGPLPT